MIVNRDNEVNYMLPSDNRVVSWICTSCSQLFYKRRLTSCLVYVFVLQVVGMVTRKDIARYREHTTHGSVSMTLLDIL